jgi:hypothetical protein
MAISGGSAAAARETSGPDWVAQFPGSAAPDDCAEPFRSSLKNLLAALGGAGASVQIASTLRPPERAYLMHWSWKIANNIVQPPEVPAMPGVAIEWLHRDSAGQPDIPMSRSAARHMVDGFGLVTLPALVSRHTQGRAVDMNISWIGELAIATSGGPERRIASVPRSGMNPELHQVGAGYGVIKAAFANDPPHWSDDGH